MSNFDLEKLRQAQQYGEHLRSMHGARNSMMDDMERMYLLVWDEEREVQRKFENVKLTKSPDARNSLLGAIRLLIAADPIVRVPFDPDTGDEETAGDLEQYAGMMWKTAGRIRGDPIHYDVVRSALLWDEMHISVTATKDLVAAARGGSRAQQVRAEQVAKATPYLFDVHDPRAGYPDYDAWGLRGFYREVKTTAGQLLEEFGEDARRALLERGRDFDRYETVTLCDMWDMAERQVWISGREKPVLQAEHGLPFIPWVCSRVEGSRLFERPEDQRQPFLYTLWRSGLWKRQNLLLTVMYTQVFALGANPMFVEKLNPQGAGVTIDSEAPGMVARVPYGGDYYPMQNKGVIDPSLEVARQVAEQKREESTIYGQTLGEPMGKNAPFSMVSLLSQAGRLPLTVAQRKAGWAIADALQLALRWQKADGDKGRAMYSGKATEISADEIPEDVEIEVSLDVSLPQDNAANANVAGMVVGQHLGSRRWARENLLKIGQSDQMEQEIQDERAADVLFEQYLYEQMMQVEQLKQQMAAMKAQALTPNPSPDTGRGGAPGQAGPELAMMPPGAPPEMAAGAGGMMGAAEGVPMAGPLVPGGGPNGGMGAPAEAGGGGWA